MALTRCSTWNVPGPRPCVPRGTARPLGPFRELAPGRHAGAAATAVFPPGAGPGRSPRPCSRQNRDRAPYVGRAPTRSRRRRPGCASRARVWCRARRMEPARATVTSPARRLRTDGRVRPQRCRCARSEGPPRLRAPGGRCCVFQRRRVGWPFARSARATPRGVARDATRCSRRRARAIRERQLAGTPRSRIAAAPDAEDALARETDRVCAATVV